MQRGEVEVKPLTVSCVKRLPDGPGAMRVQVVPNHVHLLARARSHHAIHEGDQVVLRAPLAAVCQHLPGMHIKCSDQRLRAIADIFEFATTQPSRRRRAPRVLALDGLNAGLLVLSGSSRSFFASFTGVA